MAVFPSLFLSHGAPTLLLDDSPARHFLAQLGTTLGPPQVIIVITAHWESDGPAVGCAPQPETLHDFYGFPSPLYRMTYPAPGGGACAGQVAVALETALDQPVRRDAQRGLDHGIWVPLALMYPEANIPVVPVAVQPERGPDWHLRLGAALRTLRQEAGALVIGSGSASHNLGAMQANSTPTPAWVTEFTDWLADTITANRRDALCAFAAQAPHARHNHPTPEHFWPLFAALGAAAPACAGQRCHQSVTYGTIAMDAYRWDG